ncbi:MAG: hypothetical protein AAGF98_06930 [Cyanobacteria bacterium P01_H01_bin.153]
MTQATPKLSTFADYLIYMEQVTAAQGINVEELIRGWVLEKVRSIDLRTAFELLPAKDLKYQPLFRGHGQDT